MEKATQPSGAYSYLIMAGHIACDLNQSTVPAMLPFLVAYRGIDYASAAGLMFASSSLSSLIQPLFGLITDKKQKPWLMGLGILMTGLGIASIGFLENYWAIFAVIMFAGIGSSIFHPEGGRMANCVAGEKIGRGISIYSVGGNLGFVIGPLILAPAVTAWGLHGTAIVLIPTVLSVTVFFAMQKRFMQLSDLKKREVKEKEALYGHKDDWRAFMRFNVAVFSRSIVNNGMQTFIPLYWVSVLLQTQHQGSLMVTAMAGAAVVGAFTGGRLADRFGFRRVIRTAVAFMFPLGVLLLISKSVWIATILVVLIMTASNLAQSPSVALGQKYLPNHVGLASGVTLGLAVSLGGICSPLLGSIGDNYGLTTTLSVLIGVSLIAFLGTLLIKEPVEPTERIAAPQQ